MKNQKLTYSAVFYIFLACCTLSCSKEISISPNDSGLFLKLIGNPLDDNAGAVAETPDGGFVCVGTTTILVRSPFTGQEVERKTVYLAKTDRSGNRQWARILGGENGKDVKVAPDGGFYVLADSLVLRSDPTPENPNSGDEARDYDFVLIKTDAAGNQQSINFFGEAGSDQRPISLSIDASGQVVMVGTVPITNTIARIYISRFNPGTGTVFTRSYGIETPPPPGGFQTDSDLGVSIINRQGRIIVSGRQVQEGRPINALIAEFDEASIIPTFNFAIGGEGEDVGKALAEANNGVGYLIAGYTTSPSNGARDVLLVRTNAQGGVVWQRNYGGPGDEEANFVAATNDGGFIVVGKTNSFGNGGSDIYILKVDAAGNEQWSRTLGGSRNDEAKFVMQSADGGYVVLGNVEYENNVMMALVKLNANGSLVP